VIGEPTWWKTLLTFVAFSVKTLLLVLFFMWLRWTIPRFRYDQLMDLGWKVFIPLMMVYIMVMALAIFLLDEAGVPIGWQYSGALIVLNLVIMGLFLWGLDRGTIVKGATANTRRRPGGVRRRVTPSTPSEVD
jgi:NADH-quinone oxidoreductase subunit H